jgi:hypothetical protein
MIFIDNYEARRQFQSTKQGRNTDLKSRGDTVNALESQIPFPALDLADICPMKTAGGCQFLLRPFLFFS